jgi:hypothetical protein
MVVFIRASIHWHGGAGTPSSVQSSKDFPGKVTGNCMPIPSGRTVEILCRIGFISRVCDLSGFYSLTAVLTFSIKNFQAKVTGNSSKCFRLG